MQCLTRQTARAGPSTGRVLRIPTSNSRPRRVHSAPTRPLIVLGIESSADDSCCAIVTSDRRILANEVVKQHDVNAKYGGIHPLRAQEGHTAGVPSAISSALQKANLRVQDVDAIAYTRGPGMHGCLSVGAASAQALAAASGKTLLGIHHMQAHALTPLLTEQTPPQFPFLVLLVSGGHTQLVLANSIDSFEILINKLDSSIGDGFDKIARALRLPTSTNRNMGAILEDYASRPPLPPHDTYPLKALPIPFRQGQNQPIKGKASRPSDADVTFTNASPNPTPLNLAFSFSGLLSATTRLIDTHRSDDGTIPESAQREISRLYQSAAIGHLIMQLKRCLELKLPRKRESHRPNVESTQFYGQESGMKSAINGKRLRDVVSDIVVSGGVASNMFLRQQLRDMTERLHETPHNDPTKTTIRLSYPPIELCTDNAAMIAWTGILRLQSGATNERFGLAIRPKWSLEDLYDDLD